MSTDRVWPAWRERLLDLSERIRVAAVTCVREAVARDDLASVSRAVGQGAGDTTFGLDVPTEDALTAWLEEVSRTESVSLLTEDAGWRHLGPDGELPGFDHGGPRIVVDPVDGTRSLMTDLRSAWCVLGVAGPGPDQPRASDLVGGILTELSTSRAATYRTLEAPVGGPCQLTLRAVDGGAVTTRELRADDDARVDNGYFCFFGYDPRLRGEVGRIEQTFFERLAQHEGADLPSCWDDTYLSNGGQLALLAMGTYRMICDPRGLLVERPGYEHVETASKPYDIAGAVVCARAAGCVITTPLGEELDFPLDTSTSVGFVGFANRATAARLQPHLKAALES